MILLLSNDEIVAFINTILLVVFKVFKVQEKIDLFN